MAVGYNPTVAEQTLETTINANDLSAEVDRDLGFGTVVSGRIGYGTIHPAGFVPNLLVTIESYYSLIANALITGVGFARFARPTAKVLFSEVAVIAPYRDGEGLMFRLVNGRSNQLIEVRVQVLFARFVYENGRVARRFDFLELERNKVTFFPLSWTVVHPITEASPLYGLRQEDYIRSDAEVLILLTASDETFSQTVHTRAPRTSRTRSAAGTNLSASTTKSRTASRSRSTSESCR
jgi:inward rectifier potassium channel